MQFNEFCAIVKKWKTQGSKLKIKNLNSNETYKVISYDVMSPCICGTIISFEVKPSYAFMIREKEENTINEIDENTYELKFDNNSYQIIIM